MDPGMCDDWDPDGGANRAVVAHPDEKNSAVEPPPLDADSEWDNLREQVVVDPIPIILEKLEGDYLKSPKEVVGQLGGKPSWIQGDETPDCDCGKQMTFVCQLEQCGSVFNFGGGRAYAFVCEDCSESAKFLRQN